MRVLSNFVKGEMVPPAADEFLDDVNPATGEVTAKVPRSRGADVDFAVAGAGKAFASWSASGAAERAGLLEAVARRIEERAEELAQLASRDSGRPISLARERDVPRAAAAFRFFAGAVRHDATAFRRTGEELSYALRAPLGVVALVTPAENSLGVLSKLAAAALAAGNGVVAKPSHLTPLAAAALAEIFHEVKAPEGVLGVVHGTGPEAGEPLVRHPGVALVSFTGRTATGSLVRVAAAAAPERRKVSIEPGGKGTTLVFSDADVNRAVEGAVTAGITGGGEDGLRGSRLLVERSLLERFTDAFVARVNALKLRPPSDPEGELGALLSEAHRAKLEERLALALEEGGKILTGGARPQMPPPWDKGAFFEPTVIAGLSPRSRTAAEDAWGPVVTVHPFEREEEAIAIANGVAGGPPAWVYTRDLARAHRLAASLQASRVRVNCGFARAGGFRTLDLFSEMRDVFIEL